jgi:putative transcriptional regulator
MKNTLKVERAKLDITQQELADKVGVSRQTINSIEAERYVPSTVLAIKISDVFKTNVNEIFKLNCAPNVRALPTLGDFRVEGCKVILIQLY